MADTSHLYKPKALRDGVIAEDLNTECVVYDRSRNKAHLLNSTLAWVWRHCDGSRTVDDLAAELQQETDSEDAHSTVITGLKQLAGAHLLVPELDESRFAVAEVSRREIVASAFIVAPMITSILAPTPAAAKSKPDKIDKGRGHKKQRRKS
jgi:hypothetical protein